jgi:hypothetical protein
VKHDDFVMASGEMTPPEFTTFLATVFTNLAAYSLDGSIHFICTDWRHLYEFLQAGRLVYTELKNLVVWAKTNAGMGSFYRSQHELILVSRAGAEPISTPSSSVSMAVIAPICGPTLALTACNEGGWRNSLYIRP